MAQVGYARVSSYGQSLAVQLEKLGNCERIFSEKISARSADGREELQNCLQWVRDGDVLIVTKLDRLARSTRDLLNIANTLERAYFGDRDRSFRLKVTGHFGAS